MKLKLSKNELNAVAARAKAGDRPAFELLIQATLGLYHYLARRFPVEYRDDIVAESVLYTYHILDGYDGCRGWLNYAGTAVTRRQRQYYSNISKPVTASEMTPARHHLLPEYACGVADPSWYGFVCKPDIDEQIDAGRDLAKLNRCMRRMSKYNRDSCLMEMREFCNKHKVSRQRYHQMRKAAISHLREQMGAKV